MPIGLKFQTDKREFPNGIELPFKPIDDDTFKEIYVQAHLIPADDGNLGTEVHIVIPPIPVPDSSLEVSRIYFNGPFLSRLGFYYNSGSNKFPTAGFPTNGFVIDPGIIVRNDTSISGFYLRSQVEQVISVFFYASGNK